MSPRRALLALAVAAAPVLQIAAAVPHPALGDTAAQTLAIVAQDRQEWFRIHLLAAAAAALTGVSALVLASLVRTRSAGLATAGAAASVVGSFFLVFAFAAEAQLMSLAADPSLDPAAMAPLLDLQEEGTAMALLLAGFPLVGTGGIVLMTALIRSSAVPRWQPVLVLVGTVVSLGAAPGSPWGPLLFVPGAIGTIALATSVARARDAAAPELVLAA